MVQNTDAIYDHGVLRPIESLPSVDAISRRNALALIATFFAGCSNIAESPNREAVKHRTSDIDLANDQFFKGDYKSVLANLANLPFADRMTKASKLQLCVATWNSVTLRVRH